jgi:hypothetical protein
MVDGQYSRSRRLRLGVRKAPRERYAARGLGITAMTSHSLVCGSSAIIIVTALAALVGATQEPATAPVTVKFHEPKTAVAAETSVPIDPTLRVQIQNSAGMAFGLNADGIRLTFSSSSIRTLFKIDNQMISPNTQPRALLAAKTPEGKARHGFESTFQHSRLKITHVVEAIPTRPAKQGDKRRLDAVLVRYVIENKDTLPHTIATRVRIDTHCNNDGALFAAPTFPKKILDGMEMKEKTLPPYVQILQNPDLNNPINMGHFTLKLGARMIGPDRFVCTAHGAGENGWEVAIQRAGGDSDCVMYWKEQTVQPNSTITMAYAYGKGLAVTPESEGRIGIAFGGSFEPGKLFTISAYVDDPISNQTIELELPSSMELIEGKRMQPVPVPPPDSATSMVLWKCRVKDLGEHTLRIRSSSGVTQTRTITVARP